MRAATKSNLLRWGWVLLLGLILITSIFQLTTLEEADIRVPEFLRFIVEPDSHPGWFLALVGLLPMLGFPMSVFCLLAGMKFGVVMGTVTIGAAMALHLVSAYWLGHSYLKAPLHRWLEKRGYQPGKLPEKHQLNYAITFVAMPFVPYAAKNYLLAMTHLRLRYYLAVGWTIQMLYSLPLIALTGAVQEGNPTLFIGSLLALVLIYAGIRAVRRRNHRRHQEFQAKR